MVSEQEFGRRLRKMQRQELLLELRTRKWAVAGVVLLFAILSIAAVAALSPLAPEATLRGRLTASFALASKDSQRLAMTVTLESGEKVQVLLPKGLAYRPEGLVEIRSYRRVWFPGGRVLKFSRYLEGN